MEDKNYLMVVLLMLLGITLIIVGFLIEFYNMKEFKKCYKIDFKSNCCARYINY